MRMRTSTSLLTLGLVVLGFSSSAHAGSSPPDLPPATPYVSPPEEDLSGFVFRGDASARLVHYSQGFDSVAAGNYLAEGLLFGPQVGLNPGWIWDGRFRLGVGLSWMLGHELSNGGGGLPYTGLDGLLRWSVGPTFGVRFQKNGPLEIEGSLAYAYGSFLGSQAMIGADDNVYPLSISQHGLSGDVTLLWRPWGGRSWPALHGGVSLGWLRGETSAGVAEALTWGGQLGVSVGL